MMTVLVRSSMIIVCRIISVTLTVTSTACAVVNRHANILKKYKKMGIF